ncbi:MAG: alpha/beta fold hydrolase [Burkholderiaceae bacterium]
MLKKLTVWRWPAFVLFALALIGCQNLEEQQRKWIILGGGTGVSARSGQIVDGMDDVWIEHASAVTGKPVRLHALWAAHRDPNAPVLLYLHGARRDVESSAFRVRQMNQLGFAVLAIDYRGFGRSSPELPSEAMVYEDANAAWAWLAQHAPQRERYIFGHSLGGAIAIHLASEVLDAKGLIVEGAFTSIPEVFQTLRWGWLPVTALITQRFDAADRIGRVQMPVLVVHGSGDSLILPALGRALYERARSPKRFVLVDGGTHYSTNGLGAAQYRAALRDLFGLGA